MATSDELVERLVDLREQAATIAEQINETTDLLLANREPGETIAYRGRPIYRVTVSRLFDREKAAAVLDEQQKAAISKLVLDAGLAKANLDAETYANCQKAGKAHLREITR